MKSRGIVGLLAVVLLSMAIVVPVGPMAMAMPVPQHGHMENIAPSGGEKVAIGLELQKSGHTEAFGGGDYVGISNGKDAWIAVIYGTEENPNGITIISMYRRYVGAVNIYDSSGGIIMRSKPIAITTVYMQRFDRIYEFNDTNGDGIANAIRPSDSIKVSDIIAHEPVYKAVSLKTAWERSEVKKITDSENVTVWEFSLKGSDLPYVPLSNNTNTSVGDGKLNTVKFTFHLKVSKREIHASVPVVKVTLNLNGTQDMTGKLVSFSMDKPREYNGTALTADIKYDQDIIGWDFDPRNTNPGIVLETHILMGGSMSSLAYRWMAEMIEKHIKNSLGAVEFEDDSGENNLTYDKVGENIDNDRPRIIKKNTLRFADNWQRVGLVKWVSNATAFDNETSEGRDIQVKFMIYGAMRGVREWKTPSGMRMGFAGVILLGGFSYPGAYRVVHDPSYVCDANLMDIHESSPSSDTGENEGTDTGEKQKNVIPGFDATIMLSGIFVALASAVIFRRK